MKRYLFRKYKNKGRSYEQIAEKFGVSSEFVSSYLEHDHDFMFRSLLGDRGILYYVFVCCCEKILDYWEINYNTIYRNIRTRDPDIVLQLTNKL